jgi:hypothetical protein
MTPSHHFHMYTIYKSLVLVDFTLFYFFILDFYSDIMNIYKEIQISNLSDYRLQL